MIIITDKILRFIDHKPQWWVPGTMIGTRPNKDTKGAYVLYKTLRAKIRNNVNVTPTVDQDGLLLTDIADGAYQVLEHGKSSIMIIPDPDYTEPDEDAQTKQKPTMPPAPNWETATDADMALYKLKTGQALQASGRFSGGFPGWCDSMDKAFAVFKLARKPANTLPGQRTDLNYYDELLKIIGDQSVSDTVKIRALKELQAAKPRDTKERKIRRIVIPE